MGASSSWARSRVEMESFALFSGGMEIYAWMWEAKSQRTFHAAEGYDSRCSAVNVFNTRPLLALGCCWPSKINSELPKNRKSGSSSGFLISQPLMRRCLRSECVAIIESTSLFIALERTLCSKCAERFMFFQSNGSSSAFGSPLERRLEAVFSGWATALGLTLCSYGAIIQLQWCVLVASSVNGIANKYH